MHDDRRKPPPITPVVVAGAGVTGLAIALALADRGARVVVCDPAPLGQNASGVAAGMLAPAFECALDPTARPHFPLLCAARDLWPRLAAEAGVILHRSGARATGDRQGLQPIAGALDEMGAAYSLTENDLFTPEDWRLDPQQALTALRSWAAARGVVFLDQAVASYANQRVTLANGVEIPAATLVLATGASRGLAPEQHGLVPIKGHILQTGQFTCQGPAIRGSGIYLCPTDGGIVAGATMEFGRDDLAVDPAQVDRLKGRAATLMPELAGVAWLPRVGVRAGFPDGLPMVGPSTRDGVLLAVGLRRNGWLLAPLVGQLVASYAQGNDPGPWAGALHPRRFEGVA